MASAPERLIDIRSKLDDSSELTPVIGLWIEAYENRQFAKTIYVWLRESSCKRWVVVGELH